MPVAEWVQAAEAADLPDLEAGLWVWALVPAGGRYPALSSGVFETSDGCASARYGSRLHRRKVPAGSACCRAFVTSR